MERLLRLLAVLAVVLTLAPRSPAQDFERPVDVAPTERDIGDGYQTPEVQRPLPRAQWHELLDVGLLAGALGLAAWLVLRRRSRAGALALTVACLAYFGFYREGCVCPIGAIQNVSVALAHDGYAISYVVIAIFFLPLVAALFFGRVFCSGVCPLGAIQELVVFRPLRVPRRLDRALGSLKWVYLALAIGFALLPAASRDFVICRYDPFVGFFRMTGFAHVLLIGAGLLVLGMFVGRPYCRYLCPYGALLSLTSRLAWRSVSITPSKELDCGLCVDACPYGAIVGLRAERSSCLACARCYRACPHDRAARAQAAGSTTPDAPHGGAQGA
jgi:polyferredoxin